MVSERLSHQALIYRSQSQLTATTAAFVRVGLEAGDPVLVAAKPATLDALRAELGPDAGQVELRATGDWFSHPFQRLQEMRRLTAEARPGTVVRLIDEWTWDGSDAATREWARLESVTNHVLAGVALRLVSLFDARSLPASVLEIAARTHPELIENGAAVPSPEIRGPGPLPARRGSGPAALGGRSASPLARAAGRRPQGGRAPRSGARTPR